ncbi:MAG: PEP-CTERM sorting domain-containing protein [Planctomycetota bacterium]|jgi:hypothetical protein
MKHLAVRSSGLAILVLAIGVGAAQAVPLDLDLLDYPDITSGFIDLSYDASSDLFEATGSALQLDDDGSVPPEDILQGSFDLSATIDEAGILKSGSLTIGGVVPSLGFNSGTLLTGDLTDFGFRSAGGDPLEFLMDVSGGDAAGLFGAKPAGVILTNTGFGGSFDADFGNSGGVLALADVAPIPLPGTLGLSLVGAGVIGAVRRRRA